MKDGLWVLRNPSEPEGPVCGNARKPLTRVAHQPVGRHAPSPARRVAEHSIWGVWDERVPAALEQQVRAGFRRDDYEVTAAGFECVDGLAAQPLYRDCDRQRILPNGLGA